MSLPLGLAEELSLARLALLELEAAASFYWQRGQYGAAGQARAEAQVCRQHIRELESTLSEGGDHAQNV